MSRFLNGSECLFKILYFILNLVKFSNVTVMFLFACFSLKPCTRHTPAVPGSHPFASVLFLISPCRECIVICCKTIFESWNESWLCYWSTLFPLWAPCSFIHICISTFTQPPLLSTSTLDTFFNCGIWLSSVRRPRFSFRDLHADARRVKLFKCCPPPPMKTPETRHHCDSSCASESIALLKQENNFYTCSCNYFQASLFLWCLCEFQQVTHCFEYIF